MAPCAGVCSPSPPRAPAACPALLSRDPALPPRGSWLCVSTFSRAFLALTIETRGGFGPRGPERALLCLWFLICSPRRLDEPAHCVGYGRPLRGRRVGGGWVLPSPYRLAPSSGPRLGGSC